jgi:MYXO-CTERM domain-containing protein
MTRLFTPSVLLVGLFSTSTAWATNTVTVPSVSAQVEDSDVAVEIELANDDTVQGFQFTLLYPSEALQITEVTVGDYASAMSIYGATTKTAGEVVVLAAGMGDSQVMSAGGAGTITTVVFSVPSGATPGDYDLVLEDVILSDSSGTALSVSSEDGVFTIGGSGGEEGGEEGGEDTAASGDDGGEDTADAGDEGGSDTGEDSGKDGCGCTSARSRPASGSLALVLGLLGWVGSRRRRAL